MKIVSFILGALSVIVECGSVQSVSGVELDKMIAEGKTVFTKFYSPKCPHCVRVAPLWEELAKEARDFVVAEVDCTANREACKRFNVQGVPSLQLVKQGKVYLYKGAREMANFLKFATGGFSDVQASDLPGAEKIKTLTERAVEASTELVQQLSAIANYSPLAVFLLLGLGFLSGASVTGLVALAANKKPCEAAAGAPCAAVPATAAAAAAGKKVGGEKTD
jgi:thiol-disulfide isomerase/thioredoxin